jgi:hypothetical protein
VLAGVIVLGLPEHKGQLALTEGKGSNVPGAVQIEPP